MAQAPVMSVCVSEHSFYSAAILLQRARVCSRNVRTLGIDPFGIEIWQGGLVANVL